MLPALLVLELSLPCNALRRLPAQRLPQAQQPGLAGVLSAVRPRPPPQQGYRPPPSGSSLPSLRHPRPAVLKDRTLPSLDPSGTPARPSSCALFHRAHSSVPSACARSAALLSCRGASPAAPARRLHLPRTQYLQSALPAVP